jgi:DNA-binding response OmpR family regulator
MLPTRLPAGRTALNPGMATRILYVDDEEDLRALIQSQLTLEGYAVDVAGNGASAIASLARSPYDVVLLDLHMPDMDGADVIEELNRRGQRANWIVLTGDTSETARTRCLALGVDTFLHKPFHFRELVSSINRVLGQTGSQEGEERRPSSGGA